MATQLCQKCKQSHPGRVCDYDEKGECTETITVNEVARLSLGLGSLVKEAMSAELLSLDR
jgi:hypothetical protein